MKLVPTACVLLGALVVGCGQLVRLDEYSLAPDGSAVGVEGGASDAGGDPRADGGPGGDAEAGTLPKPACDSTQVLCGAACVTAVDCEGCKDARLFCAGTRTCVTSCQGCVDPRGAPTPIECFACDRNQANAIGTCQPAGASTFCLNGDYSTAYRGDAGTHCDCSGNDVSNCPGAQQVCVHVNSTDWCITCGEQSAPSVLQGLSCKGGGACNVNRAVPACL